MNSAQHSTFTTDALRTNKKRENSKLHHIESARTNETTTLARSHMHAARRMCDPAKHTHREHRENRQNYDYFKSD